MKSRGSRKLCEGSSALQRGTLSTVTRRLGDAREGVCKQRGHVHGSHVGAWPAEPPNRRGERSNWGKQVRMLPLHLFPKWFAALSDLYTWQGKIHLSFTVNCLCQHPETLHELNYPSDFISKCISSWIVSRVCECAEVT